MPDRGALGVVKNLIDKDDSVDPVEAQRVIDAEVRFQENVTERWKADMGSDVKLAKLIRPLTLIALMVMFMLTMTADSIDGCLRCILCGKIYRESKKPTKQEVG